MRQQDGKNRLIRGVKQKNAKAQREFFDLYSNYLFKICFRYLCQRELTEDVLSEVFLKIFTQIAFTDIEDEVKLKAWIKRIAINQCLQEIRKKTIFSNSLELYEGIQEAELQTDENLLSEDLIKITLQLPIGYRTVFSLYVIEGYTHQEIAEKLQISVGTSKSQLSKARKIVKTRIIEMGLYHEKNNRR